MLAGLGNVPYGDIALGDLTITGYPPPKLLKALAVLAEHLHPELDKMPGVIPGKSKDSCILASVITREFLYRIGFKDADVRSVVFMCDAHHEGEVVKLLGIGDPRGRKKAFIVNENGEPRWDGHVVVTVAGYLIDTVLWTARRPEFPNLPPMMAVPLMGPGGPGDTIWGMGLLAGQGDNDNDNRVVLGWLDNPLNDTWKKAPDYLRRHPRQRTVQALIGHFGKWTDP